MPKNKRLIRISVILFVFFSFVFFPSKFSKAEEATIIWHKEDDLNIDEVFYIDPGMTLIIEKGAEIKLGQYAYISVSGGRIIANGTEDEPIKITSKYPNTSALIEFYYPGWVGTFELEPSFLRYVEFSNGGYEEQECIDCSAFWQYIFPSANAFNNEFPALYFKGGKLHVENCTFKDNKFADIGVEYWKEDKNSKNYSMEVINSNFLGDNESTAVLSNITCENTGTECMKKVLLKDNWYDYYQGPTEDSDLFKRGKKVSGVYLLNDFRNNNLIADPTIIIPGIIGSEKVGKTWKLDPITYSYSDLVSSFQKVGYIKNFNLFEFPYEWRDKNENTADKLKQKIQEIKDETKISKVDLVAHSMGGLIARYYIESDEYQNRNDVDQLITLGTPHKGSPKAYLQWEAGEGFFGWMDSIMKHHFKMEAKHAGYDNLNEYIQEKVPSVQELLPDYSYLKSSSTGEIINYGDDYPRNLFLEDLNKVENVNNLSLIRLTNISGVLDNDQSTISNIRIVESTEDGKWEHGMPENFYAESGDKGLEMGKGDETVPEFSAKEVPIESREIKSFHSDLPTKAQCEVIGELVPDATCHYTNEINISNLLLIKVYSPIDIQILSLDNDGNIIGKAGKDFENNKIITENVIEGSYYSGFYFGEDETKDNEFLTIPNSKGKYKILTQGTDSGNYKIELTKITEDTETDIASEKTTTIEGTAIPNQEETQKIEITENEIIVEEQDKTPPEISIISPEENKNYLNNETITVDYQIQDDQSSLDKINSQSYLDSNILSNNQIDLSLQNLGEHKFKVTATDEAGNKNEKEISFNTETSIDSIIDNTNHYFSQELIKTKQDKIVIISKLNLIKKAQEIMEKIKENEFIKDKTKERIASLFEERINFQLDWLSKYVAQRSKPGVKNGINPKAGSLLLESFNFVKYKF